MNSHTPEQPASDSPAPPTGVVCSDWLGCVIVQAGVVIYCCCEHGQLWSSFRNLAYTFASEWAADNAATVLAKKFGGAGHTERKHPNAGDKRLRERE